MLVYRRWCRERGEERHGQRDLETGMLTTAFRRSSGEVCEVKVVGWRGDGSPEFARRTVRSSRGWFCRSRPREVRKTCQGKARKESKQVGTREESRWARTSPELTPEPVGTCGRRSSNQSSLAVFSVRGLRGKVCGREGVFYSREREKKSERNRVD
jgi:hypothetical protein